ncbi:copper transport protein CTR2 [Ceratobasidium sp. AG-Ba]|nr:copper transport protein CTR2 [Ceratobasidium sp. AG-Ba]
MDHSMHHMDMDMGHGGMDHGGHGGHGGMDMGPKCDMNMLWNTQIVDTCIVFKSWHISSKATFFLSFLAIVALGVGYEWLRRAQTILDVRIARSISKGKASVLDNPSSEETPLNPRALKQPSLSNLSPADRISRAALYGASVFLSFFLMLVFMTYNAYLILAVVLGASLGHYIFGAQMDAEAVLNSAGVGGKGMACH